MGCLFCVPLIGRGISFVEIEDVVGDNLDLDVIVENITNVYKKVA